MRDSGRLHDEDVAGPEQIRMQEALVLEQILQLGPSGSTSRRV